jgi:hypothetical protein
MSDTDQLQEDEVLRRMLATPPEKHKPLGTKRAVKRTAVKDSHDR